MTVLQQISNPYLASLILGLSYGLTFCTSACLPYIISYIAGIRAGFRKGIIVTSIYNSGRIVAYAIIGTIVGLLSAVISEEPFSAYQQYSSIAFGAIIIFIGATGWLLNKAPLFTKWLSRIGGIALVVMGLGVLFSALLNIN